MDTETKKSKLPLIILLITLLFIVSISGFFIGKSFPSTPSTPNVLDCDTNSDCVIAFEINNSNCCNCPFSTSREVITNNKNLVEYEMGNDYSKYLPVSCKNVICEPCPQVPTEPYCLNNVCLMKAESDTQ